jgi:hypothetical protein
MMDCCTHHLCSTLGILGSRHQIARVLSVLPGSYCCILKLALCGAWSMTLHRCSHVGLKYTDTHRARGHASLYLRQAYVPFVARSCAEDAGSTLCRLSCQEADYLPSS